jgi:hypothetical protein
MTRRTRVEPRANPRPFLPHPWHRLAVEDLPLPGGLERRERGFHWPALAVPRGEGGDGVDGGTPHRGAQGDLAGAAAGGAEALPDLAGPPGLWPGRHRLSGAPGGRALRFPPGDPVVLGPPGGEPPSAGPPCDGRWPPHTRRDTRATGRDGRHRAGADAPHRLHAGRDEASAMGIRPQAPIGHAHLPLLSARRHRRHPGASVGEAGRDHPRQEQAGARRAYPEPPRHGNAASRRAGVSGMAPPEPSTRKGRWPCPRPSSTPERGTARLKRAQRRAKPRRGRLARA